MLRLKFLDDNLAYYNRNPQDPYYSQENRVWIDVSRTRSIAIGESHCKPLLNYLINHGQGQGYRRWFVSWWCHQMETFSALLALYAGNSPVTVEFPAQRPVMRSFDLLFDFRLNKRLSKESWCWWFETPSCPLWRHCNGNTAHRPLHEYMAASYCSFDHISTCVPEACMNGMDK